MITGIVLGTLTLACALALCQRVWIKVVLGPARRAIDVRYLLLHFRVPREHGKKRRGRKKKGQKKRAWERGEAGLGWIKLVPELLRAGGKGLRFLLRHSELRHVRVEGSIGAEDAATTGILWGLIQAAYGSLGPWGSKIELALTPDFEEGNTRLLIDAEGAVRLGVLLATLAVILRYLPKRKIWRLLWEQRHTRKGTSRRAGLKMDLKKEVRVT